MIASIVLSAYSMLNIELTCDHAYIATYQRWINVSLVSAFLNILLVIIVWYGKWSEWLLVAGSAISLGISIELMVGGHKCSKSAVPIAAISLHIAHFFVALYLSLSPAGKIFDALKGTIDRKVSSLANWSARESLFTPFATAVGKAGSQAMQSTSAAASQVASIVSRAKSAAGTAAENAGEHVANILSRAKSAARNTGEHLIYAGAAKLDSMSTSRPASAPPSKLNSLDENRKVLALTVVQLLGNDKVIAKNPADAKLKAQMMRNILSVSDDPANFGKQMAEFMKKFTVTKEAKNLLSTYVSLGKMGADVEVPVEDTRTSTPIRTIPIEDGQQVLQFLQQASTPVNNDLAQELPQNLLDSPIDDHSRPPLTPTAFDTSTRQMASPTPLNFVDLLTKQEPLMSGPRDLLQDLMKNYKREQADTQARAPTLVLPFDSHIQSRLSQPEAANTGESIKTLQQLSTALENQIPYLIKSQDKSLRVSDTSISNAQYSPRTDYWKKNSLADNAKRTLVLNDSDLKDKVSEIVSSQKRKRSTSPDFSDLVEKAKEELKTTLPPAKIDRKVTIDKVDKKRKQDNQVQTPQQSLQLPRELQKKLVTATVTSEAKQPEKNQDDQLASSMDSQGATANLYDPAARPKLPANIESQLATVRGDRKINLNTEELYASATKQSALKQPLDKKALLQSATSSFYLGLRPPNLKYGGSNIGMLGGKLTYT